LEPLLYIGQMSLGGEAPEKRFMPMMANVATKRHISRMSESVERRVVPVFSGLGSGFREEGTDCV